ncbi:MAG: hypothetical protein BWY68_00847 [bacterium ADurb.Bin400]|nr:MAG: hypothetical protein BWY68_00847 [bacterium ADurb.Bin400]
MLSTSLDQEVERQTKIINSNDYSELISVTAVQKFGLSGKKLSQKNKTTGAIYSTYYFEKNGYTYSIPSDSTDNDGNTQMGYRITETFSFSR